MRPNFSPAHWTFPITANGGGTSSDQFAISYSDNVTGAPKFEISDSSGTSFGTTDGSTAMVEQTWNNVVGVFDGATVSVWLNGVQGASAAAVTTVNNSQPTQPLIIGDNSISNAWHAGGMAHLGIWNRALKESEIKRLYIDPLAPLWLPGRVIPIYVPSGTAYTVAGSMDALAATAGWLTLRAAAGAGPGALAGIRSYANLRALTAGRLDATADAAANPMRVTFAAARMDAAAAISVNDVDLRAVAGGQLDVTAGLSSLANIRATLAATAAASTAVSANPMRVTYGAATLNASAGFSVADVDLWATMAGRFDSAASVALAAPILRAVTSGRMDATAGMAAAARLWAVLGGTFPGVASYAGDALRVTYASAQLDALAGFSARANQWMVMAGRTDALAGISTGTVNARLVFAGRFDALAGIAGQTTGVTFWTAAGRFDAVASVAAAAAARMAAGGSFQAVAGQVAAPVYLLRAAAQLAASAGFSSAPMRVTFAGGSLDAVTSTTISGPALLADLGSVSLDIEAGLTLGRVVLLQSLTGQLDAVATLDATYSLLVPLTGTFDAAADFYMLEGRMIFLSGSFDAEAGFAMHWKRIVAEGTLLSPGNLGVTVSSSIHGVRLPPPTRGVAV